MPIMDGLESTRMIIKIFNAHMEKHPDGLDVRKIPIIALTANDTKEERQACLQSGMSEFLCKPPDMQEFRRILKSVFGWVSYSISIHNYISIIWKTTPTWTSTWLQSFGFSLSSYPPITRPTTNCFSTNKQSQSWRNCCKLYLVSAFVYWLWFWATLRLEPSHLLQITKSSFRKPHFLCRSKAKTNAYIVAGFFGCWLLTTIISVVSNIFSLVRVESPNSAGR